MKKVFTIVFFVTLALTATGQFPSTQFSATPSTMLEIRGAAKADSGLVIGNFVDTTAANRGPWIKTVPYIRITVGGVSTYMRNSTASAWLLQGPTPTPNWDQVLSVGGTLTTTRTANFNSNTLNFSSLGTFHVEGNNHTMFEVNDGLGSIEFTPAPGVGGKVIIDNLANSFSQDRVIGQLSSNNSIGYYTAGTNISFSGGQISVSGLSSNNFTFGGSLRWASVDSFGGDPTGAANSTAAAQAAVATGRPTYFGYGRYKVEDTLKLSQGQAVFGMGRNNTEIITTSSINVIKSASGNARNWVNGIRFVGSGKGTIPGGVFTPQNAIWLRGNKNLVTDCIFDSLNGYGMINYSESSTTILSNMAANCQGTSSTGVLFNVLSSEYGQYTNITCDSCFVAFYERASGNNTYHGIGGNWGTEGFRLRNTGNGDHGTVDGFKFNHNSTDGIKVEGSDNGFTFTNGDVFSSPIDLGTIDTARNIRISNVGLSNTTINGQKCLRCDVNNNYYVSAVVHAGSGITYYNNQNSTDPTVANADSVVFSQASTGYYRFVNLQSTIDTTTYKPGGYDVNGKLVRFSSWGNTLLNGLTVGITTVASGTSTRILYDNAGVLGEYTITGTGTVIPTATTPTFTTSIITPKVDGSTASGGTLILESTSNGTKGKILFGTSGYDEVNNRLGIGNSSPTVALDVTGQGTFSSSLTVNNAVIANSYQTTGVGANGNFFTGSTISSTGTTTAGYLYLGASTVDFRVALYGNSSTIQNAGAPYGTLEVASSTISEAGSGTHPLFSSLVVLPPTITNGVATTTDLATVYISGRPVGITPTNPSTSLWVGSGIARISDTLAVGTTTPTEVVTVNGQVRINAITTGASTDSAVSILNGKLRARLSSGQTVASNYLTAQNASVATVTSYATPATDGTYRIGGDITITAVVTDVIVLAVTYTDETNTSRTQNFFTQGVTTASLGSTGAFAFPPMDIRAKASTTITVATTVTGAGAITYDTGSTIQFVSN